MYIQQQTANINFSTWISFNLTLVNWNANNQTSDTENMFSKIIKYEQHQSTYLKYVSIYKHQVPDNSKGQIAS